MLGSKSHLLSHLVVVWSDQRDCYTDCYFCLKVLLFFCFIILLRLPRVQQVECDD